MQHDRHAIVMVKPGSLMSRSACAAVRFHLGRPADPVTTTVPMPPPVRTSCFHPLVKREPVTGKLTCERCGTVITVIDSTGAVQGRQHV